MKDTIEVYRCDEQGCKQTFTEILPTTQHTAPEEKYVFGRECDRCEKHMCLDHVYMFEVQFEPTYSQKYGPICGECHDLMTKLFSSSVLYKLVDLIAKKDEKEADKVLDSNVDVDILLRQLELT